MWIPLHDPKNSENTKDIEKIEADLANKIEVIVTFTPFINNKKYE